MTTILSVTPPILNQNSTAPLCPRCQKPLVLLTYYDEKGLLQKEGLAGLCQNCEEIIALVDASLASNQLPLAGLYLQIPSYATAGEADALLEKLLTKNPHHLQALLGRAIAQAALSVYENDHRKLLTAQAYLAQMVQQSVDLTEAQHLLQSAKIRLEKLCLTTERAIREDYREIQPPNLETWGQYLTTGLAFLNLIDFAQNIASYYPQQDEQGNFSAQFQPPSPLSKTVDEGVEIRLLLQGVTFCEQLLAAFDQNPQPKPWSRFLSNLTGRFIFKSFRRKFKKLAQTYQQALLSP